MEEDPYTLKDLIGKGAYGQVYLGIDNSNGENVALKRIAVQDQTIIEREVAILKRLADPTCQPNILCLRDFFYDEDLDHAYLVTNYVPGLPLDETIQQIKRMYYRVLPDLYWDFVASLLKSILKGLAFIHDRGIIHGDIKPDNIIVNRNLRLLSDTMTTNIHDSYTPVIIDFGLSCFATEGYCLGIRGTIDFMSPELFSETYGGHISEKAEIFSESYGGRTYEKSDIWALGISMLESITEEPVWPIDYTREDIQIALENGNFNFHNEINTGNETIDDFLINALNPDPGRRPSAVELYNRLIVPKEIQYVETR